MLSCQTSNKQLNFTAWPVLALPSQMLPSAEEWSLDNSSMLQRKAKTLKGLVQDRGVTTAAKPVSIMAASLHASSPLLASSTAELQGIGSDRTLKAPTIDNASRGASSMQRGCQHEETVGQQWSLLSYRLSADTQ